MTTLGQLGEHEIIRRIRDWVPAPPAGWTGIGDDAAVVPGALHWNLGRPVADEQVLTSDAVIEGVHFLAEDNPRRVGNKAAGRVLSDLAAMGAVPRYVLVNVEAPPGMDIGRLEALYRGMLNRLKQHDTWLVGGDVSSGSRLALHLFALGTLPGERALLRSRLSAGDALYVTGELGGSRAGRHLDFVPRVEQGIWLREGGWARGMIDLSDGLLTDLRHVLEASKVGACIERAAIPLSRAAASVDAALKDGEDYELLFGVEPSRAAEFEREWAERFELACTRIGAVTAEAGVLSCIDEAGRAQVIGEKAHEHFQVPDA